MPDYISLLPPNASAGQRTIEQTVARTTDIALPNASLWDPWTCPKDLLPTLAWALSINEWRSDWPETYQRQMIAASIEVHRQGGTVAGLREALRVAGFGEVELIEGHETVFYDGAHSYDGRKRCGQEDHWATFALKVTNPLTAARADEMRRIVDLVVPARCHLREINFTEAAHAYEGAITFDGSATYGTVQ